MRPLGQAQQCWSSACMEKQGDRNEEEKEGRKQEKCVFKATLYEGRHNLITNSLSFALLNCPNFA